MPMYRPETNEPYSPVSSKGLRVATFCFFFLLTPIFGYMALEDLAELIPAPIITVKGNIGYVESHGSGRKKRTFSNDQIIYLQGNPVGFTVPKNVFTSPTKAELRAAHSATISYYDEKRACPEAKYSDSVWSASRGIEIYSSYNPYSDPRPSFSDKCHPIVAISLDGKEYLSLTDFRLQVFFCALIKMLIACAVPVVTWFVRNIAPGLPTPPHLTGINKEWEEEKEKFRNMTIDDFK